MVKKNYFSSKSKIKLHPWFITGFIDGEGSFSIRIRKKINSVLGFHISIVFSVCAQKNSLNLELLEQVKEYFGGVGSISKSGNMYIYEISAIKDLVNVCEHFNKFPLQTTKHIHYVLWCQVKEIIENKEHLTKLGFNKILSIKYVFPKGLSTDLLEIFTTENLKSIAKPIFEPSKEKLDLNWIAGFTQADGSFGLNCTKSLKMRLGYTFQPQFRITQHERDLIVLKRIIESMGCGTIVKPTDDRDRYNISVANITDIINIIIPLFENNPLYGAKYLDFMDFCKGIYIIKSKGHLTEDGLNKLKSIVSNMNTQRKY